MHKSRSGRRCLDPGSGANFEPKGGRQAQPPVQKHRGRQRRYAHIPNGNHVSGKQAAVRALATDAERGP